MLETINAKLRCLIFTTVLLGAALPASAITQAEWEADPSLIPTPSASSVFYVVEPTALVGERTLAIVLNMPPRVIDSEAPDFEDIDTVTDLDTRKPEGYTKRFMSWYAPEMKGLERRTSAAQVMRGPLVLAKGRAVGTSRTETLEFNTINKQPGWKLSLAPQKRTAANAAPWGAWNLTLEKDIPGKGVETKTIPVADYWSVSCMDDPENWFSLWF